MRRGQRRGADRSAERRRAPGSAVRFDISFGPPPVYRLPVLQRALAVLGPDSLQFGSDQFLPCPGGRIRAQIAEVAALADALALDADARRRIMSGTAAAWLGLSPASPGIHEETHSGSSE